MVYFTFIIFQFWPQSNEFTLNILMRCHIPFFRFILFFFNYFINFSFDFNKNCILIVGIYINSNVVHTFLRFGVMSLTWFQWFWMISFYFTIFYVENCTCAHHFFILILFHPTFNMYMLIVKKNTFFILKRLL